jgi:3'(2'), 5'-bisphosphate nucleotidase
MRSPRLTTADDHALAHDLAERAGRLLLDLRAQGGDPAALKDAGDRSSHEFLMAELAKARPEDAVLSEEGMDDKARLTADRVWIVDPLDGTREFGEPDRPDWAVHVALVIDGFPVAGAVALPALGEIWSTASAPPPPPPAPPLLPPAAARPRLAVSRTRPGWSAGLVERALSAELVPMGSAGFKALAVVRGTADIYAHSGGQYEWDSAAPVAVALAHGMHASRLDGTPLAYDNPDPYLPDLLIAHPDWARSALQAVAREVHPC